MNDADRSERWAFWWLVGLLVILGLFITTIVMAAPAPLPRKAPAPVMMVTELLPKHLEGTWELTWGGGIWRMELLSKGAYVCSLKGEPPSTWTGTWHVNSNGMLCVSETTLDENGIKSCDHRWAVVWTREADGKIDASRPHGCVLLPDGSISVAVSLKRFVRKVK